MRKIFKSKLFYLILGMVISSSVTVYAVNTLLSKDVGFVPTNSSWNVNNVEDALNDLYENDTFYLHHFRTHILGKNGGYGIISLNSEKYNTLTIDSRTRSGTAGTTYWQIFGYENDDCTGTETVLLNSKDTSSSLETFDISNCKCVKLIINCTTTNGVNTWYQYYYNGITLLR